MDVIRTDSDLKQLQAPELAHLIDCRIKEVHEYVDHFSELVYYVVVHPDDAIADVESLIGFTLLRNRFDGQPFGSPRFTSSWEVIEEHEGYYELVFVLSDDGMGVTLFIEKSDSADPDLSEMCRKFTVEGAKQ